jgi:predicted nucleic acid-binding protein
MQQVLDRSVVIKWFIPEKFSDKASRLLADFRAGQADLIEPELLRIETANVLWKRSVLLSDITPQEAAKSFAEFVALNMPFQTSDALATVALNLAIKEKHRVYDMTYIALAIEMGCEFITADESLLNKLGAKFPFMRWLGDL